MGNIFPNIKPTGLTKRDLVDALGMLVRSLYTLCVKIDTDTSAGATTHLANCYTAIINAIITDSKGNRTDALGSDESSTRMPIHIIGPGRIDDASLNAALYQIVLSIKTLCTQLDTEAVSFTNYLATAYTAIFTPQRIEDGKGNFVGVGTGFTFKPGGMFNQKHLVEILYKCFQSINLICADNTTTGLDGDSYTDTDYNALCYTAICTLMIENGAGSRLGVSR